MHARENIHDHACTTSNMQIKFELNIVMLSANPTRHPPYQKFKMLALRMQWSWSLQNICKKSSSLHSYFQNNFESPHNAKTIAKSHLNNLEKNTKINLVKKMKNIRKGIN
jgi:hypothetical protein